MRKTRFHHASENVFVFVGRKALSFFEDVGGLALLVKDIFLSLPKAFTRFHLTAEQMLAMGVGMITGMGGASLISRLIGANNISRAERALGNANTITITMSLVIMVVGLSNTDTWLRIMGASETILPYAREYMTIILIGMYFQTFAMSMNNLVRAEGNARVAMIGMVIGAGLNIILDALFIALLDMGIRGAALATVVAQLIRMEREEVNS